MRNDVVSKRRAEVASAELEGAVNELTEVIAMLENGNSLPEVKEAAS